MTDDDFGEFTQRLQMLADHIDAAIEPKRILTYFRALKHLALDEVRGSIDYLMRHWRRTTILPLPVEIHEATRGDLETLALLAWERVRTAQHHVGPDSPITFDDPATHAVIALVGGWRAVSMWAWLDVEQLGFRKLEFVRLWKHYMLHPPAVPPPAVLNDDLGLRNPVRRVDARGLPEPLPAKALAAPETPALPAAETHMIDVRAEWPKLKVQLPEMFRPEPPPPRKGPRSPEDVAALERERAWQLERLHMAFADELTQNDARALARQRMNEPAPDTAVRNVFEPASERDDNVHTLLRATPAASPRRRAPRANEGTA
jgi:hypothetical protein